MLLNENIGSIITQDQAVILANSFDRKFPNEVTSSFIGSANLQTILNQKDCIGVRIYNGYDEVNGKISLIIVGVDSEEKDILVNGIIFDEMATCPPICSADGLLSK